MTFALETRGLCKRFGGFVAVDDVNLKIEAGARHALIGPNGAGKTTLINLLTGFLAPDAGEVILGGKPVTRLPAHERVERGLARTFQINRLFADFTVLESVALAVCERRGEGRHCWRPFDAHAAALAEAEALLATLGLDDAAATHTRHLSYGRLRLVEIALALATRPRVLVLDEPAAGVPAAEGRALFDIIAALPRDMTVLLVEHDMDLVFRYAERISVLVGGAVLAEGDPRAIADDARVRQVYLGEVALG